MKNYQNSDYALNKYSKGIVYRFADGIVEVTLADYLAENPEKNEADFLALKELSDGIYLGQVQGENAQTKKNTSFDELGEIMRCYTPSPEDLHIGEIDAREESERRERRAEIANRALNALTDIQRRRYLMYRIKGLTLRQIADIEGVVHSKIQKSVEAAENKIKNFLSNS